MIGKPTEKLRTTGMNPQQAGNSADPEGVVASGAAALGPWLPKRTGSGEK